MKDLEGIKNVKITRNTYFIIPMLVAFFRLYIQ